MPIVAWYMLSNESYMNRVIKEVFPTVDAISTIAFQILLNRQVAYHSVPPKTPVYLRLVHMLHASAQQMLT